ncbi:Protein of unknown function DUF1676 [Cinara cedri]|uniref:Uncharacterized protein n=1 Tax=Cinara cedri TaxID=506608 RepID=A0A5E4MMF8_9HEMI|nr:Protein of unknown function DUF1676 [Cinara cedri]
MADFCQTANRIDTENILTVQREAPSPPAQVAPLLHCVCLCIMYYVYHVSLRHVAQKVLTKKCLHRYTMTCMKLDLIRLIDRLGTARAYQLVPGVSLVRAPDGGINQTSATDTGGNHSGGNGIPADVVRSLVRGNESADELDGYLMERVDAYLGSLSISVKLVDTAAVENVRKLSSQMLVKILPTDLLETGNDRIV